MLESFTGKMKNHRKVTHNSDPNTTGTIGRRILWGTYSGLALACLVDSWAVDFTVLLVGTCFDCPQDSGVQHGFIDLPETHSQDPGV
jgi:hypothetical protein